MGRLSFRERQEVTSLELRLSSAIPPSVNHYLSYRAVMKSGRAVGMSYVTKEAAQYKKQFTEYVKREAKRQNWTMPLDKRQHFYVDAIFYFDRTDRDCNNYFKVMLDAITDSQIIWVDDNVVCERVQRIYYDTQSPRVELTIHPVEYIGVFDDAQRMDDFCSVCIGCSRNSRNCSIQKKAINGFVQPEVRDGKCDKYKEIKEKKDKQKMLEYVDSKEDNT